MKKLSFYFIGICLAIALVGCKSSYQIKTDVNQLMMIRTDLNTLAADDMEGRETGTPGEAKAAAYISKRMEEIGLEPKGDNDGYIQLFSRRKKANPHADESENDPIIYGKNILGFINNQSSRTIVIGAHYDHLGYGAEGSLYTGEPAIHNGADDNASGVSAMLYLADQLMEDSDDTFNYLFIAFSGEEKGLWGSNYFAKHPTITKEEINYMINMDMVGRLNEERKLAVYGTGTSPIWEEIMPKIKKPKFDIKKTESGVGPSDHTSFYLEDIPVLHFFTGQHEDYHRPTDDAHLINFDGIEDIAHYILQVVEYSEEYETILFTKTKDETSRSPDFKVTLGVIPDYLFDGKGMRIDGTKVDRPAFNAGIMKGDVVVKMGDIEVTDMMSYMKALSAFQKGQTVEVIVNRSGEEIKKMVTF